MRLQWGLVIAVFLFAATAQADAPDARVEAFQRICIDARANFAASAAATEAGGWTWVSEDVRPELVRLFAMARTADTPETPLHQLQAFRHEGMYLVLSEMTVQGRRVHGCYVYDFAETEALPSELFVRRLGSEPSETINQPGMLMGQKWVRPASLPNVATLRVGFIPQGSPVTESSGFSGLALAATSLSAQQ